MKILFTGASSFTGMWFVKELTISGHQVTAVFPRRFEEYQDLRGQRVGIVKECCRCIFSCPFGSQAFLDLIEGESHWDLLCHHAADVTNYKSPDFDFAAALAKNTSHIKSVLEGLSQKNCRKVILTGSVFEQGEGEGSEWLRAVSPYGLSKGLTADVFQYFCHILKFNLGKFVIPNPFGPYEEPRFTSYLIKNWFEGNTPEVTHPDYIRDNIPVDLLAKAYCNFIEGQIPVTGYQQFNPSFYTSSQGEFTARFAKEMRTRLNIACPFTLKKQTEFPEPRARFNTDPLDKTTLRWDEKMSWDNLAAYYQERFSLCSR